MRLRDRAKERSLNREFLSLRWDPRAIFYFIGCPGHL